jgi:hypothetical protein
VAKPRPLTVVGGSVACLVAADARLRRGGKVELLLPEHGIGGGFAPLEVAGRRLGLGVRLLEIDREDAGTPPPLADYRPGPNAHSDFVARVAEWVEDLVGPRLREVDRPMMALDGRLVDDIYFTVDLDGLAAAISPSEAERIALEARCAAEGGDAGVLDGAHDLLACSLEEASLANHGETFHRRFIESMCAKIHPGGAAAVPAALRRKLWMPLFYPRTLAQAAAGEPTGFRPRRPFHTVEPGGMGEVVDALLTRIRRAPGAHLATAGRLTHAARGAGGATELEFSDGRRRMATQPVIGTSAAELFAAIGAGYTSARVPLAIAWAQVAESDVLALATFVHTPDPDVPAFRISPCDDAPAGARVFTVELRHDTAPADITVAVRESLQRVGVVREGAPIDIVHHLVGPGFPDPSRHEVAAFAHAHAALENASLDAEVVGGAAAFGADSFNEQVIQGLRAEEILP